ncbi:hypothetical protein ABT081_10635 [Streptomyces sp. NPDC002238]|uniref:hypothetical protein n=1 Tax=Streptomyces sp. NPDC002238 TaxID=3156649 RepID=UPI003323E08F
MDLGDAAGWAAFAISGGALFVAVKAQRDGRRSANAAEASVEEARLSRVASERSATVAEETLADQRREAAERRAAEEEANRPRAALSIEHSRKAVWQLINSGTATARNIRLEERPSALVRGWEEGDDVTLDPGEVHEFMMSGSMQSPMPPVLRLVWEGQDDPVPLRVPPRVG